MKHNVYFEGKVQSLEIQTQRARATVGVIEAGKYTFSTSSEERMVIIEGTMRVKLAGKDWQVIDKGKKEFVAPKNSSFDVDADTDVAYICYYL